MPTLQQIAAERLAAKKSAQATQAEADKRIRAHDEYQAAWGCLLRACQLKWPDVKTGKAIIDLTWAIKAMGHGRRLETVAAKVEGDQAYLVALLVQAANGDADAAKLGASLKAAKKWTEILTDAGNPSCMARTRSVWRSVPGIGRGGKQSPTIAAASK